MKNGYLAINEDITLCDVAFRFTGSGKLGQIVYLSPYLLYNTLSENLDEVDIGGVDPFTLEKAEDLRDEILDRLKESFKKQGIKVAVNEETGKIMLDESILFDFNSYELKDEGKACIDGFLKAYAEAVLGEDADDIKIVRFDGHTDTKGSYDYNMELSQKRADSVLQYCTGTENKAGLTPEQKGLFAAKAKAVGHSYDDPVLKEDGEVDMDASRRVEINFFINIGE